MSNIFQEPRSSQRLRKRKGDLEDSSLTARICEKEEKIRKTTEKVDMVLKRMRSLKKYDDAEDAIYIGQQAIETIEELEDENRKVIEEAVARLQELGPSEKRKKQHSGCLQAAMEMEEAMGRCEWSGGEEEALKQVCGKTGGQSFAYLLLDQRKYGKDGLPKTFKAFVQSIFYVGKGLENRPSRHITETLSTPDIPLSRRKYRIIRELLDAEEPIGKIALAKECCNETAETYEFFLVCALGIGMLTNLQPVRHHMKTTEEDVWDEKRFENLGAYVLHKAWKATLHAPIEAVNH